MHLWIRRYKLNNTATFSIDTYDPKVRKLPPGLFERIIFKSKELRWLWPVSIWLKCVRIRNVVCLKNINLMLVPKYAEENFCDENMLKVLNELDYPIKTLSLRLHTITDEGMKNLAALGSNLESLDLTYIKRFDLFWII